MSIKSFSAAILSLCGIASLTISEDQLEPIKYNNPGLIVDLGVGLWAWPLPMDYDADGDMDLIVSCPDVPFSGTYFFENPTRSSDEGLGASEATAKAPETSLPTPNSQPSTKMPIFKPPVRIADKMSNVQICYLDGKPIFTSPGKVYLDFPKNQYSKPISLGLPEKIDPQYKRIRANQWKLLDWENDGDLDVIVGIGVWDDYGWDDAWDKDGNWTNGPLHGYVYLVENLAVGSSDEGRVSSGKVWKSLPENSEWPEFLGPRPKFAEPVKIEAGGKPVDVYGMPSPNFADFDGDGDLDLICGEFLDGFRYFPNSAQRSETPQFQWGSQDGQENSGFDLGSYRHRNGNMQHGYRMDLQMITPVAVDWDQDGDMDIISGDEDGRVALLERLSEFEQIPGRIRSEVRVLGPMFRDPEYFQQESDDVKFGALVTPVSFDWDADGDEDLVCGNTAGYIGLIENTSGGDVPTFSRPDRVHQLGRISRRLIDGGEIRQQAGQRGSIQGPCEAKWGYSTLSVADWNHDGKADLIVNGIEGKVKFHSATVQQTTTQRQQLGWAENVLVNWSAEPPKPEWVWWTPEPGTLTTQWRTTPCALDWNEDGHTDLIMLDHEGYLAYFERNPPTEQQTLNSEPSTLNSPRRIFKIEGPCEFDSRHRPVGDKKDNLLRLNANRAGASGRRKLHFVDWDGDGRLDLLVNSDNVNWLKNVRTDEEGFVWFKDMGPMDTRKLAGHTTSPTTVDWDKNGIPDLLVGAEDGRLYYKKNPRAKVQ